MRKDEVTAIMDEYDKRCALYSAFTEKIEKLIKELIKENDLRVHSVTSRVKTRASLQAKLGRSERKFSKLGDIPDISGIRIITYFPDDVDSVARVIQKEFEVDEKRSVDKRELLDPDRFGYLSLHHIVKLPTARSQLTEYRRFKDCYTEIQVRSILQHAWAEIEHDLGYKGKHAVPKEIRRRFSRLAGLLEVADSEFAQIRDSLAEYEKTVPQRIIDTPALVLIDKASLLSFVKNSQLVHEIDSKIASVAESRIVEDEQFVTRHVREIQYVGLETIEGIDSSLRKFKEIIIGFAKLWITPSKYETLNVGICLAYLCYVLIGKKKSVDEAYDFLAKFEIGPAGELRRSLAEKIISVYSKAVARGGG